MAVPFLNHDENSLNLFNFKKNHHQSKDYFSCLKSISSSTWAIFFSILIYITIFYAFNLSPSFLLSTTFWFLMSNTLLLIIATDLTSFLNTNSAGTTCIVNPDHDQIYYNHNARALIPFSNSDMKIGHETNDGVDGEESKEYVINTRDNVKIDHKTDDGNDDDDHCSEEEEIQEKVINVDFATASSTNKRDMDTLHDRQVEKKIGEEKEMRKCDRSNSDGAVLIKAVEENEEKVALQRTLSERREEPLLEEEEFSNITNEELNRRVEKFIRRFNRQIRLQSAAHRHSSSDIY